MTRLQTRCNHSSLTNREVIIRKLWDYLGIFGCFILHLLVGLWGDEVMFEKSENQMSSNAKCHEM